MIQELQEIIRAHEDLIDDWLAGAESYSPNLSDEYLAFSNAPVQAYTRFKPPDCCTAVQTDQDPNPEGRVVAQEQADVHPRWLFFDAPPSAELSKLLERHNIAYVTDE